MAKGSVIEMTDKAIIGGLKLDLIRGRFIVNLLTVICS